MLISLFLFKLNLLKMVKSTNFCCICIETHHSLKSVTDKDENDVQYCEKLTACEPNQNWDDNTLNICESCTDKLNGAYEFINLCKESETLRSKKVRQLQEEIERQNAESQKFTCDVCQKSFKRKRFLKVHITRIHLKNSKSKNKGTTDEKENGHTSDPNIPSSVKLEETVKNEIKDEILEDDFRDNFLATNNDENYSSDEEDLTEKPRRQRRTQRQESFTCEYCGKQFNRNQHWAAHIRSKHTFEKPYKCKLCDARFVTSHSLLVHKRNHNNERPYICSICGKGFVCSGDLFHHTKIHLNKKEYQCNICNKRFNTTSILRTHKIVKHTEPKDWKYVCALCERRFPINSGLSLHMKRHTGVKDHACHICGKKFFNKSEVTKHILSHSNQKHFKCTYCEVKEYKNREGLNKHLKIVHDVGNWKAPQLEKKFLCPHCPKMFTFNNKLQRHLFTHSGEKPFKCQYCEKKFSDNYYRKSHMRKEHNIQSEDEIKYVELVAVPPGISDVG